MDLEAVQFVSQQGSLKEARELAWQPVLVVGCFSVSPLAVLQEPDTCILVSVLPVAEVDSSGRGGEEKLRSIGCDG